MELLNAIFILAKTLRLIGLYVDLGSWTMNQDYNGVTIHFQWQDPFTKDYQNNTRASNHKSPSRKRRDAARWRKYHSKGGLSHTSTSQSIQSTSGTVNTLNVHAPVFKPSKTRTISADAACQTPVETRTNHQDQGSQTVQTSERKETKKKDSTCEKRGLTMDIADIFDPADVIKNDLIQTKSKLQKTTHQLKALRREKDKEIAKISQKQIESASLVEQSDKARNELIIEQREKLNSAVIKAGELIKANDELRIVIDNKDSEHSKEIALYKNKIAELENSLKLKDTEKHASVQPPRYGRGRSQFRPQFRPSFRGRDSYPHYDYY